MRTLSGLEELFDQYQILFLAYVEENGESQKGMMSNHCVIIIINLIIFLNYG